MELKKAIKGFQSIWEIPKQDIIAEVLDPAFGASHRVQIMAGFYSSGAIRELAYGLSRFLNRPDGKLQIVCSQYIDKRDVPLVEEEVASAIVRKLLLNEEGLQDALLRYTRECISYLCQKGRIEIKVAVSQTGLFHKKVYIFSDEQEGVVLIGSANFSVGGFRRNQETMILGRTWDETGTSAELYRTQQESFERLWSNREEDVKVYDISKAHKQQLLRIHMTEGLPDVPDILTQRGETIEEELSNSFKIPADLEWETGKYSHQGAAIKSWEKNSQRGILSIATGGGKTITALIAAFRLYQRVQRLHILIVVPTRVLATQWAEECKLFGLKETRVDLRQSVTQRVAELSDYVDSIKYGIRSVAASIVLMDTLKSDALQKIVRASGVPHLIIGDECHNLGTESLLESLPLSIEYRLGLSATPVRQYDEEGTYGVERYFGGTVYNFGIADAIGVCLVPYSYYIYPVYLTGEEAEEVIRLTKRIRNLSGTDTGNESRDESQELKMLLIRRAKVIESAELKLSVFQGVYQSLNEASKKYSIVFCSSKDKNQLPAVQQVLEEAGAKYRRVTQEESGDSSKMARIISDFKSQNINILLAKKVLDEGANIPQIQTAFFMASSTSEREWIQRRGRVLRKSPGKLKATLHDFVCLPPYEYRSECKSVFTRELKRAMEFSESSDNRFERNGGRMVLERLRSEYGL